MLSPVPSLSLVISALDLLGIAFTPAGNDTLVDLTFWFWHALLGIAYAPARNGTCMGWKIQGSNSFYFLFHCSALHLHPLDMAHM